MQLPLVIPRNEGSRLTATSHYDSLFSTFCLDTKSGAKKWRQTRMAPPVLPASAQQNSNVLIVANQLSFHYIVSEP
jgi:hypothetical protein